MHKIKPNKSIHKYQPLNKSLLIQKFQQWSSHSCHFSLKPYQLCTLLVAHKFFFLDNKTVWQSIKLQMSRFINEIENLW